MNTNIETTNIETTNIDKHFFPFTFYKEDTKNDVKIKKYTTKIATYCFYSINESNICDKIKKIPYYQNNYAVIEMYDYISINQLNEQYIEKLNLSDDNRYLIFKYKNDKYIKFNDFLFDFNSPKLFIFHIIDSFSYLLQSLIKLNDNNICFFNLSPNNIVFNLDCGEKPLIKNFQLSLHITKLNEIYITNIIKKLNDFTHKPLEVHVLFYLIQNDISTISYSFIEEICEIFIKKLSILDLFSEKYIYSYKESCIESLKKYINKPKSYIISGILDNADTWDVYSLSVLYLHIFGNISRVFSLNQPFITKIILELTKNIAPEPLKRNSLQNLLYKFNELFNFEKDWSYINNLPGENMMKLFDDLDK
jgi:hypothetical protein